MKAGTVQTEKRFSEVIHFRDVQPRDKDMLLAWRNRPEVARNMYNCRPITTEEHERWFASAMEDPSRCYWIITWMGKDVGLVNLCNIDRANQRAYWAFYLGSEAFQGKGIGSFVEFCILEHIFNGLKLNKLCCEVLAFNAPVVQMHERFGFRKEGMFRQHICREDGFHDVYCLAILNDEWQQKRPEILQRLERIAERLKPVTEEQSDRS